MNQQWQLVGAIGFLSFGGASSLHCLGMCAPLTQIFGVQGRKKPLAAFFLYHLSRILSYSLCGALLALLGIGINHTVSSPLTVWVLLLLLSIYLTGIRFPSRWLNYTPLKQFRNRLSHWLPMLTPRQRAILLGGCSPLLPCGVLYFALAAAAVAPTPWMGAFWMALFAMGTIPLLLLGQIGLRSISSKLPHRFEWWVQKVAAFASIAFIVWMHFL
jgi:sulfite exporter TauE/SafE